MPVEPPTVSFNVPQPSKRFLRAASTERDGLVTHRRRLEADRTRRLGEVQRVDEAITDVDDRLRILNQMLGDRSEAGDHISRGQPSANDEPRRRQHDEVEGRQVLSGPAIREVAVQVLLRQPEYIEALHYRRWYELVRDAGYAVAGKDPLAVFLTQFTRSPAIQKSTETGIYELDRQAPLRLRQQLERLNAELKELRSPVSTGPAELDADRARRHEPNVAIGQTERALDEALRVLRRDGHLKSDLKWPGASRRTAERHT